MTIDASAFNFDAMKQEVGVDPFAAPKGGSKYTKDERFYTLAKDKDGNGAALIRFLFDSEKAMIQTMYKINTTIIKNSKKRFVNEFSPSTIGAPCPFQEKWQDLWNEGKKENVLDTNGQIVEYGSKSFGRATRYVTNILVLKDPTNPENEGKVFLYELSGAMKTKIEQALSPSDQDRALGAQPKELFNPIAGNSFRLVAKKGSNGQINYDSSEVVNEVTAAFATPELALDAINTKTHKLSGLLLPESFMTYDELVKKLEWVTFSDNKTQTQPLQATVAPVTTPTTDVQAATAAVTTPTTTATTASVQTEAAATTAPVQTATVTAAPAQAASLDDLLNGI